MEASQDGVSSVQRASALLASEPKVPDYDAKMSRYGRRLQAPIWRAFPAGPDAMDMFKGEPNPDYLPLAGVTFTLKTGETLTLDEESLARCAKYGSPKGIPELCEWLLKFQIDEHRPPAAIDKNHPSPFGLTLCCGSTSGINSCLTALLDEHDTVLVEETVYGSVVRMVSAQGCTCQGVPCDDQGMIPESLDDILTNWTLRHPERPQPKIMYVIPYGNNPTGNTWSEDRMLQVFLICRKHDLMVLDDGAYYFVRWGKHTRSFQSIDIDGRVLRFDTFSKTLGAGHRVGWLSGPQAILDKVQVCNIHSFFHPSTLSQIVVLETLKAWGRDKFYQEMRWLADAYRRRAERLLEAVEKHLQGLAKWRVPTGGMFVWVDILGIADSFPVAEKLCDRGLIVVPGKFFRADGKPSNAIRLSYTSLAEDKFDRAMELVAEVIQQHTDKSGSSGETKA